MDIDEPATLELVEDDFEEGEHEKMDKSIRLFCPALTPENFETGAHIILYLIVAQSGGRLNAKYLNVLECKRLIESDSKLRDAIVDASENGYKSLRLLKLLQPEPVSKDDEGPGQIYKGEMFAAKDGWEAEYVGNAAVALWDHLYKWYNMQGRHFYAKYTTIVQSSGMGKSRTVDEMTRTHFVIPVNLLKPTSSGHPPSDIPAYRYLTSSPNQADAFLRSCSFIHALFHQTALVLRDIGEGPVAERFRDYMRMDMGVGAHGSQRAGFYANVETLAEGFYHSTYLHWLPSRRPSDDIVDGRLFGNDFPLRSAFDELWTALGDESVHGPPTDEPPKKRGKFKSKSEHPFVVLAFDEAHTLTEIQPRDNSSWSRFGEIRRAIRGLICQPVFTLFLSTSGTVFSITPAPEHDISARMHHNVDVKLPFTELGFDQLAVRVNFSESAKLSQVTSEEHFTSYGRPLWTHYYQSSYKNEIIHFAAFKLLGGTSPITLTRDQKLACLAQRIPIEFLSAVYASQISVPEKEQVNSHMRVILKVDDNLETMVTTSPSEPVLSEAAYFVMTTTPNFSPPQALQEILDGFAVNKGELGELIPALLFTMARDKAVGDPDNFGRPPDNKRWCSVAGLLTSLFRIPSSASSDHINVAASHGWYFTAKSTTRLGSSLVDTFKDSKVYFTHFVKVHQQALIQVKFLMRLMTRGAAVLCAHGQSGVDGIIPFLFEGDEIRPDNIGVIMFQAKNDDSYTDTPMTNLFHAMDPQTLGVISPSANIPVIRIVFALAAQKSRLAVVHHESIGGAAKQYKTYDFWVAGLSPELLVPVENEPNTWASILQASHDWAKIYSDPAKLREKLRKSMNPGAAVESEFWENWCNAISM